jgi:hypothetical protein
MPAEDIFANRPPLAKTIGSQALSMRFFLMPSKDYLMLRACESFDFRSKVYYIW